MSRKNKKPKNKIQETLPMQEEHGQEPACREIFVYAQIAQNEPLKFHPVVFELLNSAQKLSSGFKEKLCTAAIVVTNKETDSASLCPLYNAGADKVYIIKNDKIKNEMGTACAITELCRAKKPEIFLIGATIEGRSIAPVISSALDTGLTADCTKLDITIFKDEKKLAATRPTFGGRLMATILCKTKPQMATVRPSVFALPETPYKQSGEVEEFKAKVEEYDCSCIKILSRQKNENKFSDELENAKVIVAGGMGLKNEEGFKKLKKFASLIGAACAGTRKAVDKGLIDKEFQVGQTGKTVSPKVYLAFGISGAIHHISGMCNSRKVISVNTDPDAPIFAHSDVAITEDATKVLDELIEELEK